MTKQAVTGTILLLVIFTKGISCAEENNRKINLTAEAASYTTRRGEGLKKLSFANDCGTNGQPLYVTVGDMNLGDECWHTRKGARRNCKNVYWWFMNNSLLTPRNLTVNVTLRKLDKTNYTVSLDLNNATWIQWNPEDVKNDTYHQATTDSTSCEFTVGITFGGTFCFEVENARGDNPKTNSVSVVNLASSRKGLRAVGSELRYNITGHFKHEAVCLESAKKVKKLRKQKLKAQNSGRKTTLLTVTTR